MPEFAPHGCLIRSINPWGSSLADSCKVLLGSRHETFRCMEVARELDWNRMWMNDKWRVMSMRNGGTGTGGSGGHYQLLTSFLDIIRDTCTY